MPYFVLIFASVKIKGKSDLQQGFNTQETKKHRVDQYRLETVTSSCCVRLLIRHLYSSFIFDARLFLNLALLERVGGNNRESCWEPALAA